MRGPGPLEGVSAPLEFDGNAIAEIHLGKTTNWNDPAIAGQNATTELHGARPRTDVMKAFERTLTMEILSGGQPALKTA